MRWKTPVVASCVVLGGLALAWLAWSRSGASPSPRSAATGLTYANEEFQAAGVSYDLRPGGRGLENVLATVSGVVERRATESLGDEGADLGSSVAERLGHMLAPDFDAWLAATREFVPDLAASFTQEEMADVRAKWESAASGLGGAPLSSDGIRVRRIDDPQAFPMDRAEPGTIILTPDPSHGGVDYPMPTGGNMVAVEVLIPVSFRSSDAGRIPATAGMRFARTDSSGGWRPVKLFIYFTGEAFDKELPMPTM